MNTEHILPKVASPCCGYEPEACTSMMDDAPPRDGDITICVSCGEALRFVNARANLTVVAEPEYLEKHGTPETLRVIRLVQADIRARAAAKRRDSSRLN